MTADKVTFDYTVGMSESCRMRWSAVILEDLTMIMFADGQKRTIQGLHNYNAESFTPPAIKDLM